MIAPPARVGMPFDEVDTPALLIDMDSFESNLRRMGELARKAGVHLRPHAKTHKSVAIANLQVQLGAVGICCQKVAEAEIMVEGGIRDIVVTNEIVGPQKLARLAALARRAAIKVCVDQEDNVRELEAAAAASGSTLGVLVELDVGANRCGVATPAEVVRLARSIAACPHLRFDGIHAYQGSAQHLRSYEERRSAIGTASDLAKAAKQLLAEAGFGCESVTGGGTGTFEFEAASGVYNELQVGSYIFMDRDYGLNRDAAGGYVGEFQNALFLLATVMSRPVPERIIIDAGLKAFSVDAGMPEVFGHPGLSVTRAADEHGRIEASGRELHWRVGDKIKLIPGHCDPTINLHDWMVCVRNGRVEALWAVSARGAVF